jgi:hypothetical protein
MAETANAVETMASSSLVPAFTGDRPSLKEHIRSQPGATIAKSNPATYAQAVMNSEPSLRPTVKRSTRTKDDDKDSKTFLLRTLQAPRHQLAQSRQ